MFLAGIFERYKSLSEPVKASLWFTFCNILQKGISFLTVPLFTRLLSVEKYGELTLYHAWHTLISIILTLQLTAGVYTKGLLKYEDDQDSFSSSLIGLYTTNTAIWFLFYLLFKNTINDLLELKPLYVYAIFLECLFWPGVMLWSARERFYYRYKKVIVITLIVAILSPVIALIAVLLSEHKAEARILSFSFVHVIAGFIFFYYLLSKGKTFFVKKYWKYALLFNLPLIPHYLSQILLQQSDKIMIGRMIGKSQAAIYGVAYSLSLLMIIVTSAINYSYVPYSYNELKKNNIEKVSSACSFILLMVLILVSFVICLGPELTRIVASKEYYEARWIIPPVASSVFFMFFYSMFSIIEFYFEKTFFTTIITVLTALTNILLNYCCLKRFGYLAAGYTTLFCYFFSGLSHFLYSNYLMHKYRQKQFFGWGKFCMLSAIQLLLMTLILLVYNSMILRYTFIGGLFFAVFLFRKRIQSFFNIKHSQNSEAL